MKILYRSWRMWTLLLVLIPSAHSQMHASIPSASLTFSVLPSQRMRPPEILRTGTPQRHQFNQTEGVNATNTVAYAAWREPQRNHTNNGTIFSNCSTRASHPTIQSSNKRPVHQSKSNNALTILPIKAFLHVSGNASTINPKHFSYSSISATSSAVPSSEFNRSIRGYSSLPSGFIKATGGIVFGLASKSLNSSASTPSVEPLITQPPAPPIRPEGLNLTGVKAVKVYNPAWTANTSMTTISPGGTLPTVVPVLVKAAGAGLAIFGLSAALEAGAPLLDVSEAVEVAEEEATGEEDEESDDEDHSTSSTSTSSSSLTVTSTSSSSSSSLASSTSSSFLSSSHSSSTSTTTDACTNPTVFPYLEHDDNDDDIDVYPDSKVRRFNRRSSSMTKRQLNQMGSYMNLKKPVTKLGSCKLDKNTNMPPFWKANSLMGKSGNSAYWWMPVPERSDQLDAAPTYTTASTAALRTLSPNKKNVIIGGSSGFRTNVDHVYEVSLLKNFFNYYLAQKSVCRNFNDEFMFNSTAEDSVTRLTTVFSQLPGVEFGGLAGMDQRLNSIKAYFFQAGEIQNGLGFRSNGLCDSIRNLQMAGIVMDMLHSVELRTFFSDANSRIYQALLAIDHAVAADGAEGCYKLSKNRFSWANEYKGWIDWFLSEREIEIQNWAKYTQKAILHSLSQKIIKVNQMLDGESATAPDPSFDDDRKRMDGFMKSAYSQNSHWSFNFNLHYPTNAVPIAKREGGCMVSTLQLTSTLSATSTTKTSSPTAVVTQHASATAKEAPNDGGDTMQPHRKPLPSGVFNFINNNDIAEPPSHSDSANQLNNEHSANQFNNAIQRMSPPAAAGHPTGSGDAPSQAQGNFPAGSSPASA